MKNEKGNIIKEEAKKKNKSLNSYIIDIVMEYIEKNK